MLTNEMMYANNDLSVSDGQTDDYVGLETTMESDRDFETSDGSVNVILFGSGIGGGLVCENGECQPVVNGLLDPGIPAIPTGGGDGGTPCAVPIGESAPAPPAPPEQVPEVPGVDPDPGAVPNPNYCFVFNPNNPPVGPDSQPGQPYSERRTFVDTLGPGGGYQAGEDRGGLENGPSVSRFYETGYDDEQALVHEQVTIDDGQKEYIVDTNNVWSRNTSNVEGRSGVMLTIQNGTTAAKTGGAVVCDGEKCELQVRGDMGMTDQLPPVYVDDEDGEGAFARNVDAAAGTVEGAAGEVPVDEIIGGVPDPTTPGESIDGLMGLLNG